MSRGRQQTYSQALNELEGIVAEIESEEIDIDLLAEKVKRAAHLIRLCRTRLRSAETDVQKALESVGETEGASPGPGDDGA